MRSIPLPREIAAFVVAGSVTAALTLLIAFGASDARAQPPLIRVNVPGSVMLPPGGTVSFDPVPPSQVGSGLRVQNNAPQAAAVSYDGETLMIEMPAGFTVQVGRAAETMLTCAPRDGQPHVVRCPLRGPVFPRGEFVAFTAEQTGPGTQDPNATEQLALIAGCNNVTLTWPNGTPVATVAAAVSPATAVLAIWRYDAAAGRFRGWSPIANAPTDFATVNRLEPVFLCMREAGSLRRPPV